MSHEAGDAVSPLFIFPSFSGLAGSYFVIRSNMDLGSKRKVGRVTLLRSAPGRNWEMMWERTVGPC